MSSTAGEGVLTTEVAKLERTVRQQHFDRLLAQHGSGLARLAGSYTDSVSDRDDLLQEIALAVWQALPQFRGECSERTFLYRIAHNRAISFLTRNRFRRDYLESEEESEVPDPGPSPEAGLVQERQREHLRQAVRMLPITYRQVATLALEGMDYTEIAQVLGISETSVGARLTRARQRLRRLLGAQK